MHQILATLEGSWDSVNPGTVWPVSLLTALQAVSDCCQHLKHSNSRCASVKALYGLVGLFLPMRPSLRMLSEQRIV